MRCKRARQPNLSFFAFTATPKFKTLAVFDEPGPTGASPFHEYTMRQAIEEGFIMDVLQNYTTYKRFFGLIKQVEDDPEVPRKKAAKALTRYHGAAPGQHRAGGLGHRRALPAPRDARARRARQGDGGDRLAPRGREVQAGLRPLHQGATATRASARWWRSPARSKTRRSRLVVHRSGHERRHWPKASCPRRFERDDYRVLLVAEKYQTGFDQPLLQTMYVVEAAGRRAGRADALAPQPHGARQGADLRARLRQRGRRHLQGVQALLRGDAHRRERRPAAAHRAAAQAAGVGDLHAGRRQRLRRSLVPAAAATTRPATTA